MIEDQEGPPYTCDACEAKQDFLIAVMPINDLVFLVCENCRELIPDIKDPILDFEPIAHTPLFPL